MKNIEKESNPFQLWLIGILTALVFLGTAKVIPLLLPFFAVLIYYLANSAIQKKIAYDVKINSSIVWGVFVGSFFYLIVIIFKSAIPKEWDFTSFYLFGSAAKHFGEFYDPLIFRSLLELVSLPIRLGDSYIQAIVDVGFQYPPPTIFIFYPLSFFKYTHALYLWSLLIIILFFADAWLIKRTFFQKFQNLGFLLSFCILLIADPSPQTIYYNQTTLLLLFLVLLSYRTRNKPISGFYGALAVMVKPVGIVIVFYYLITKRKRAFLLFVITGIILCLITMQFFGLNPFIEYIFNNPSKRNPNWVFTEGINHSLFAYSSRAFGFNTIMSKVLCLTGGLSLIILLVLVLNKLKNESIYDDIVWVILWAIMLIVYPGALKFYSLINIVSVFILMKTMNEYNWKYLLLFTCLITMIFGLLYTNIFIIIFVCIICWGKFIGLEPHLKAALN